MLTRAITISLNSVKNCTSSCALSLCLDRTIPNPMQKQISPIIKNKEQQCDGLQESTYICRMSYIGVHNCLLGEIRKYHGPICTQKFVN